MGKPHRLPGFNYCGRIRIFITCCTDQRHRAFEDAVVCEFAISQLMIKAREYRIEVNAYCLMPDHGHLLLAGVSNDSQLPTFMRQWKQATGYWYGQRSARRLWQGNYWDHVLRDPDDSLPIARYIIADPVRSGLVENIEEYPWWGSETWSRLELVEDALTVPKPVWWADQ